jgi:hypothetical protein
MRASCLALVLLLSARAALAADDAPLAVRLLPEPAAEVRAVEAAPTRPLYKRWLFWTAVGVVSTAVTAVAVAFAVGAATRTPNYSASQTCNGPCDATLGF